MCNHLHFSHLLNKVKHLSLLLLCLFLSYSSFATEDSLKFFNGHQYVYIDSSWKEHYNNQLFKVTGNQIIVKYHPEVDTGTIGEFETQHDLTFVYKDNQDFYYYSLEIVSDIFTQSALILESPHVYAIDLPTELYLASEGPLNIPCDNFYMNEVNYAWQLYHGSLNNNPIYITGSPSVKVAVIDAGFWIDHPDLGASTTAPWGNYSNWYYNPGESGNGKETNNVDDDNNGYVDDYLGWDFFSATDDPIYKGDNNVNPDPQYQFYHGTAVAGVIAAKSGNFAGIEGVAGGNGQRPGQERGVSIIPIKLLDQVSDSLNDPKSIGIGTNLWVPRAVDYAVQMGADIINMSFTCPWTLAMDSALVAAKKKNVFLVSGSGNTSHHNWQDPTTHDPKAVLYPASGTKDLLTGIHTGEPVVAIGGHSQFPSLPHFSNIGPQVDLAGPAAPICILLTLTTSNNSTQGTGIGTSFASAFVAGVAALMRSTNPCISRTLIEEIMKLTAYKDGYQDISLTTPVVYDPVTGHSDEFGQGRIRADYAVMAAHYLKEERGLRTKELYIKDTKDDIGLIDDTHISDIWFNAVPPSYQYDYSADNSPDIWVRNVDDGGTTHQSPDMSLSTNTVYVRVRNIGCDPGTTYDVVRLYWSNAASWTSWPDNWNGTYPTVGNEIGWKVLSTGGYLMPGEERIYKFPWDITIPYNEGKNACLMARIESPDDPITSYTYSHDMVNKNNNIAMRNLQIVKSKQILAIDGVDYAPGGFMNLVNPLEDATYYNFTFKTSDVAPGQNITHEAEVSIQFDESGWDLFQATGQFDQEGIEQIQGERKILMRTGEITLHDIPVPANSAIPIYVGFSFLTDSLTEYTEYNYSVSQSFSQTPDIRLGQNTYLIVKNDRDPFQANAGPDKVISLGQSTTLCAEQLSELATYNWYNSEGDLVYTGTNLTVSPEISSVYNLEVIADDDGFKDYDDAQVLIRAGSITNLYPNPVSTTTTVQYSLQNVASAYLMLVQPYATTSHNFILNVANNSQSLDLTEYPAGVYNLLLVCDGVVSDITSLQKQ